MGRETVVNFIDDVTGKPIERTEAQEVQLIVGGFLYTLDLGAASLGKYVQPLIEKAPAKRRFSGASSNVVPIVRKPPPVTRDSDQAIRDQNRVIRNWWTRNAGRDGVPEANERGRIPGEVLDAFKKYGAKDIPAPVKAVPAAKFTDAEKASVTAAKKAPAKVPASRGSKAPAEAATPTASRARTRAAKKP